MVPRSGLAPVLYFPTHQYVEFLLVLYLTVFLLLQAGLVQIPRLNILANNLIDDLRHVSIFLVHFFVYEVVVDFLALPYTFLLVRGYSTFHPVSISPSGTVSGAYFGHAPLLILLLAGSANGTEGLLVLGDEVFSPIDVGQVLMVGVLDPQGVLKEGCRVLEEEKR